ncbi:hypothetical protein HMPREF9004_0760 [Schaalia cardiffensis F0333]|uniref:Uncharacterized protein n=1 Tax=Schaalia cardiffensis F0333 TaxID=888050 RepID=N6XBD5_9ACTO|nr:hypothetical protein HMPREF9004_0760 [Schaalia cardiffensis F0333]
MVKQTLVKSNLAKRVGASDEKRTGTAWREFGSRSGKRVREAAAGKDERRGRAVS